MGSEAPGALESVRALVNTWHIPNDTRHPVDELSALCADRRAWGARMPALRWPREDSDEEAVRRLRAALRAALDHGQADALAELLAAHRWRPSVDFHRSTVDWSTDAPGPVGDGLAVVLEAVSSGTWARLRTCPDCRWAFYDTSRNGRRTWCSMTGTDGARACGSIAKTRAYRQRRGAGAGAAQSKK